MTVKKKKRGRPSRGSNKLSREAIVTGAKELLLRENKKISIRALARHLEIDPMAIYYYFSNKAELLEAMAVAIMQDIYMPVSDSDWKEELIALSSSYLSLLRDHPGLLETLLSLEGLGASTVFSERFYLAIEPLTLVRDRRQDALSLLVDFLHGFALAMHCAVQDESLTISAIERPLSLYFQAIEMSASSQDTINSINKGLI